MERTYVHSKSRFGGKLVTPEVLKRLNAEGVIYLEVKADSMIWFFKPIKQAIQQRKNRKIFTNG